MAEGAAVRMKQTTRDQTHQASASSDIPSNPEKLPCEICKKLPWWFFVDDPIKEYEKDMALIGHEPTPAPPLPPWEMYNLAELEECLPNQRSQFLKQNEELLKLLDSLHGQEHDELVHKEDEILRRIHNFSLVVMEYVQILKKRRKELGDVCKRWS